MNKILFACSEMHPLAKTGGLADVAGSLPVALAGLGQDIRVILPAYREVLAKTGETFKVVAKLLIPGFSTPVRLLQGQIEGKPAPVYLVDAPGCFDRPGGPYAGPDGRDWPDNAARFALFSRAVVKVALDQAELGWQPDIVHCNDWQTGLIPALLAGEPHRPASVFTIHNLAYQGQFSWGMFNLLGLPGRLWSPHSMEFYGKFSFIKGGLVYADWLTTVSPTYAEEICTPAFGYGLEGLLTHRAARLTGILNGVDYSYWDPQVDSYITQNFTPQTLHLKAQNKAALQRRFNLPVDETLPLIGFVGRMVEQKGIDLIIDCLPGLLEHQVQIVILGSGEKHYEAALTDCMARYPDRVSISLGYDEGLAHAMEAGLDIFLMPSRFEPCGLNQIYSLRYGTVPVVRRTGGLADTIIDATPANLNSAIATGFVFEETTPQALLEALQRALALYAQPAAWQQLQRQGMQQDFSWDQSARHYLSLYEQALSDSTLSDAGAGLVITSL